jgi:hypothetical protein
VALALPCSGQKKVHVGCLPVHAASRTDLGPAAGCHQNRPLLPWPGGGSSRWSRPTRLNKKTDIQPK